MNYFKRYNLIVGWLVFLVSAIVYMLTIEPSASLWDCSEFIPTSYKLEVGHPPGAPLFMMIARFFSIFASPANAAMMINAMSGLASAFTILFLFWSITHLARKMYGEAESELSQGRVWTILGAGMIGSLAYAFTDTFWFSAVEAEVYAMSSMFTALVFWMILKWENVADQPHSNRWLVLIAYLMGLSIGVHILNLLAVPAVVFVYYFRKYPTTTAWGVVKATAVAGLILLAINGIIIPYTVAIGAFIDRMFVNGLGMPINSGMLTFVILLFLFLGWAVYYTHKKGKVVLNLIIVCTTVIVIGFSSYAAVVIRSVANPPMNSNSPNNPYSLLVLLNREQYGNRPLLSGPYYASPATGVEEKTVYYEDGGEYKSMTKMVGHTYPSEFTYFFPRVYSSFKESHIEGYKSWGNITGKKVNFRDEVITIPTFAENLRYFFSYQLNFMYIRYFMWNFVGRQSDQQANGDITNGNWLSGINAVDEINLGPQDNLPSEMKDNRGRNTYYFLPFILGLIGLLYHLNRDPKNFTVVLWLFVMMGLALVVYFNTTPSEVRERDYVFAGSFYAFCIWIGFGVMWLANAFDRIFKKHNVVTAVAVTVICSCVPVILIAQNWDDHDRSGRYVARDMGYNYLESALPNAILINYGDNDAFPLWFNQEVESVRPDVRIMNASYLGGDWYIDQMRIRSNESDPVPFSLPRSKYAGQTNDYIVVANYIKTPMNIKDVIDFIARDDDETKVKLQNGETVDYIPGNIIALPVNKANALASGIVAQEDAHLMVDTIYITIKEHAIAKDELMMLDMFANFDWKRPICFTSLQSLSSLGIAEYAQNDGFTYRFVPIKTPQTSRFHNGRVNTSYLYDKLMNARYGNIKDPHVYCDFFVHNIVYMARITSNFAALAKQLVAQGDTVKAVQVLDKAVEELPVSQIRNNYISTVPLIEAYYAAGATDKANAVLNQYMSMLEEYVHYYFRFKGDKMNSAFNDLNDNLFFLAELQKIADANNQKDIADHIAKIFEKYGLT